MIKQSSRLILGILLVALVGCGSGTVVQTVPVINTPYQTPTPKGIVERITIDPLDTSVCAPPCWNGLTPGVSTESDVRQFLADHPGITGCTDFHHTIELSDFWWIFCPNIEFSFRSGDGTLEHISLYDPDLTVTLEQMIQRYGDSVFVNIVIMGSPEHYSTSVRIWFPHHRLYVSSDPRDFTFVIRADMQVDGVMYLSSTPFPSEVKRVLWRGFGDYGQDFNPFY